MSHPNPEITDEMIERAARSLADKVDQSMPVPGYLRDYARGALEAALAGCTVVQLPDPNFTSNRPAWAWWGREDHVRIQRNSAGDPVLTLGGRLKSIEDAEQTAHHLLAAVAKIRRLVSESSGDAGEDSNHA